MLARHRNAPAARLLLWVCLLVLLTAPVSLAADAASLKIVEQLKKALELTQPICSSFAGVSSGDSSEASICNCPELRCAEETVAELHLNSVVGRIHFAELPSTIRRVYVRNSCLMQPLDVTATGDVVELAAFDVDWAHGPRCASATTTTMQPMQTDELSVFRLAHARTPLESVACVGCRFRRLQLPTTEEKQRFTPLLKHMALHLIPGAGERVVDIMRLPRSLISLNLSHVELPPPHEVMEVLRRVASTGVEWVELGHANLTGQIVWGSVPSSLRAIALPNNHLYGLFRLSDVPPLMSYLDISNNNFHGTLELAEISPAMRYLLLDHNNFTGRVYLEDVPLGVRKILIHDNKWADWLPDYVLEADEALGR